MPIDKKEARRQFKLKKTSKGIFAIRCRASAQLWVSSSRDLDASRTGAWFMLRNGMHYNKALQTTWNSHGAESFEFDILESFDPEMPALALTDSLRDRLKHWRSELSAASL
jgi:hypothetical protein